MNTKKKFRENMDNIREFYKKEKGKQYPIVNPQLLKLEEYEKSSYIKMLCAITQYTESEHEMQIMYLQRLISGNQFELTLEDYMKKTLELSKEDVAEFINLYKESKLRYTFCIDGMILIGGQTKKDERQIEFLVELIELLGIKKDEIEYLIGFTRAILTQNSKEYEKINSYKIYKKILDDIFFYISPWFKGKLIDTEDDVYYYANELTDFNSVVGKDDLEKYFSSEYCQSKKIGCYNLKWNVNESYNLKNKKQIEFINCKIDGKNSGYFINIENIDSIRFENCKICNFNSRFIKTEGVVNEMKIIGNEFSSCGVRERPNYDFEDISGGVFYIFSNYTNIFIEKNRFEGCFLVNTSYYNERIDGIIMWSNSRVKTIKISNNKFNTMDSKNNSASLFQIVVEENQNIDIIEENNQYISGTDILYELCYV